MTRAQAKVIGTGTTVSGDMSASITSLPTDTKGLWLVSYQIEWTGGAAPAGTFVIEVSNDYVSGDPSHPGTWRPYPPDVAPAAVAATPGNQLIWLSDFAFAGVRLRYVRTGGTGTMTAWIAAKG